MNDYVVFRGKIKGYWYDLDKSAHYHIKSEYNNNEINISINIGSVKEKNNEYIKVGEVKIYINKNYKHPILKKLDKLKYGFTKVSNDMKLDYIRGNLFDEKDMVVVPTIKPGRENDILDYIQNLVYKASDNYEVIAYGSIFEDNSGIHDVHMNQGSEYSHRSKDRVGEDGGLFFYDKKNKTWTAVFIAFKSQSFKLDNKTTQNKNKMDKIEFKSVDLETIWKIRQEVMWPDKNIDFVKLKDDNKGNHIGFFVNGEIVSIISLFEKDNEIQFRKFATIKKYQNKGYGSRLLKYVIDSARRNRIKRIWCNSREDKINFYKKFGLKETKETFEKEGKKYIIMEKKYR